MTRLPPLLTLIAAGALSGALSVGLSGALSAQEAEPPAEADGSPSDLTVAEEGDAGLPLDLGTEVAAEPQIGQPYLREQFGDWSLRCIEVGEGPDPCDLYQLLRDDDDNPVAEIAVFPLPNAGQIAAGANVVAPLETLLTEGLIIAVDGGAPRRYEFSFCNRGGCVARVGLTEADVTAFKRGNRATLRIVPALAPDQEVVLTISLTGFTAGYESGGATAGQ